MPADDAAAGRPTAKSPADHALDVVLYGPLGFLAEARTLMPELAGKGRQRFETQVDLARMIGKFAVAKGQFEAQRAVQRLRDQRTERQAAERAAARPTPTGATPASPPVSPAVAPPVAGSPTAPGPLDEIVIPVRRDDSAATRVGSAASGDAPAAETLAIQDYDALSASQVVPRLAGLSVEELAAVAGYEAAHRGRKTILAKIAQLQARA